MKYKELFEQAKLKGYQFKAGKPENNNQPEIPAPMQMAMRRNHIGQNLPPELAIREAIQLVEMLGADTRLTDVVVMLDKARNLLADVIDERIAEGKVKIPESPKKDALNDNKEDWDDEPKIKRKVAVTGDMPVTKKGMIRVIGESKNLECKECGSDRWIKVTDQDYPLMYECETCGHPESIGEEHQSSIKVNQEEAPKKRIQYLTDESMISLGFEPIHSKENRDYGYLKFKNNGTNHYNKDYNNIFPEPAGKVLIEINTNYSKEPNKFYLKIKQDGGTRTSYQGVCGDLGFFMALLYNIR